MADKEKAPAKTAVKTSLNNPLDFKNTLSAIELSIQKGRIQATQQVDKAATAITTAIASAQALLSNGMLEQAKEVIDKQYQNLVDEFDQKKVEFSSIVGDYENRIAEKKAEFDESVKNLEFDYNAKISEHRTKLAEAQELYKRNLIDAEHTFKIDRISRGKAAFNDFLSKEGLVAEDVVVVADLTAYKKADEEKIQAVVVKAVEDMRKAKDAEKHIATNEVKSKLEAELALKAQENKFLTKEIEDLKLQLQKAEAKMFDTASLSDVLKASHSGVGVALTAVDQTSKK